MKLSEPEIIERTEQPYAAIAAETTMKAIGTDIPPLVGEVFGWLGQQGVEPTGPPFWKYNRIDMEGTMELEVGVPVETAPEGDERVVGATLPGGRYVRMHHVGHPSTLYNATSELLRWATEHDIEWDVDDNDRWGARLEVYYTDPAVEPDMEKWETDLVFRTAG